MSILRNLKTSGSMIFHHICERKDIEQDIIYCDYRGTLDGESYFLRIYND